MYLILQLCNLQNHLNIINLNSFIALYFILFSEYSQT